tara:strand:- start:1606 stop:2160 length:555 start_codon:yes stop_codon:yes gene_type:complete
MSEIRTMADAVLVGGTTFRNWPYPLIESPKHGEWPARDRPILNFVMSRRGFNTSDCALKGWPAQNVELVFCTAQGTVIESSILEKTQGKQIQFASPTVLDIIDYIAAQGAKVLLIEAGGAVLFELFKNNLINDIYLTLCPFIVGGSQSSTLSDGEGFSSESLKKFDLVQEDRLGNELYLHYTAS